VLAICSRRISRLHVLGDLFLEELWSKYNGKVGRFGAGFISWILVIIFISALRSPFINCNQSFIENFFCVDFNKSSVSIVSDTTTIVGFSDQVLDCLPVNLLTFKICVDWYRVY